MGARGVQVPGERSPRLGTPGLLTKARWALGATMPINQRQRTILKGLSFGGPSVSIRKTKSYGTSNIFSLQLHQGLRTKTMENVLGGFGPEGGVEAAALALAADGAFDRAALEHFGR